MAGRGLMPSSFLCWRHVLLKRLGFSRKQVYTLYTGGDRGCEDPHGAGCDGG